MSVLTPEFLSVVPQFLSTDAETCVRGLEGLLRLCFAREPSVSDLYLMLGYNVSAPPYVRQGMFSRSFHKPAAVDQHKAAMPHAQLQLMPNTGHAAFWDDAASFNKHLSAFCESL